MCEYNKSIILDGDNVFLTKKKTKLEQIYRKIHKKQYINLDECILDGLSIRNYRKYYHIPETDYVDIYFDNGMFANFSTLKDHACLEFAWCKFHCKDEVAGVAFNNSIFYDGYIDFSYSVFEHDLTFDDCIFNNTKLYFIGCKFKNSDFRFNQSSFQNTNIYIHTSEFINEVVDFTKTVFQNTYLQFVTNTCIDCKLLFEYINDEKTIEGEYLFVENNNENTSISFQGTYADKLLFYDMSFYAKTDLNICYANYITVQQCINHDILIIGNEGYKNITHICLKDTINFGEIIIKNSFTENLFKKQKKIYFDPYIQSNSNHHEYYQTNINLPISLCDTSDEEKSMQFTVLQANEDTRGNSRLNDEYYLLARKYKNRSKITNNTILISQLSNSKNNMSYIRYIKEYILIIIYIIFAFISYLAEKIILETFCGSYATKPFKFLFNVIILILLFACIYVYLNIKVIIFPEFNQFINAFIYSIQNFFPISIIAESNGIIHLITVIEEILGTIILSLFTISYTRKVIK